MELALFADRFSRHAGILELMDDLGRALETPGDKIMLGGGNPAMIPEMNAVWRRRWAEILAKEGEVEAVAATYDAPGGRDAFRRAAAAFLGRNFGWDVGPENVAVTAGSQAACFLLFNLLAGPYAGGRTRQVLFPLAPEYIGYADQALGPGQFRGRRPLVVEEEAPYFKYHVDFQGLEVDDRTGLVCAGRPTNPTGNVLGDDEVAHLAALARGAGVPFLLDNAYGAPFPSILFEEVEPFWAPGTILTMSLSKLGLPSVRTGLVVGPEPLIRAVESANAILNLTNPGLGQALVQPLLEDDSILALSRQVIQPFYRARRDFALAAAAEAFGTRFPWRVHRPQGSIFLWFWFPALAGGSRALYARLKEEGVLVVPGDAFFFGLDPEDEGWDHRRQCIRVNYARPEAEVTRGLELIARAVADLSRV